VLTSAQQALKAKDSFQECATCPVMVVVTVGEYSSIKISKPFAISKWVVTNDEWDACFHAGACRKTPSEVKDHRGKVRRIVVLPSTPSRTSWWEATTYADWLSAKTGQRYRLPNEAELKYALSSSVLDANYFEVWTADCWHDSQEGAPTDGSAQTTGDCNKRVVRSSSMRFARQTDDISVPFGLVRDLAP